MKLVFVVVYLTRAKVKIIRIKAWAFRSYPELYYFWKPGSFPEEPGLNGRAFEKEKRKPFIMSQTLLIKKEPPAALRWIVLVFISLAMFGNYYIYDSISPLAVALKTQLKFTDSDLGLLQGIYSFPNIIMVLIGGLIIDRIGTKKAALIFSLLVFLGAFITVLRGDIYLMAAGRLIFGLGAESMIVAITTVVAQWFKGKQLSFAFGLNLTVARLGSFLALNSQTWGRNLYSHWQNPLWVSVGAGVISVLTLGIFYFIDSYSHKNYNLAHAGEQDKVILSDVFSFLKNRIITCAVLLATVFIMINYILHAEIELMLQIVMYVLIVVFSFLNFRAFSKSYWFIVMLCITFYSAMFPFQTFAIKFFQEAHGVTPEYAGFLSSILTLSAMIFTPLFGLLSDFIGKRSVLMMFGSLLIIPVYLMMGYTSINLLIPMSIMGIAFSLVPAVMWPSVSLVTPASKLGTAYGLMTMIQNIGLFGFNIVIGWANDVSKASAEHPQGYHMGMWIFSVLGFFGLLFAFLLRRNESGPNKFGLEYGTNFNKRPN
ncbi:MAG: MFS transporter [Bacteroidetes bacterium]|nr:MFS transporter [Bacteroidota bacterium]